ncbi:TLC domain-containing protein [Sarcoptes scabiei]|uniref:TLC domain-containing protein n=1 Tax=Sarcoptes scabiei TaxID=52283 RepID=A0A132A6Y4_SARSC|nr:TLC domain-containing protein [Sarcoptes scabiei]
MIERQNDKYNAINPAIGFLISLTSTVAINQFNYVLDCPSIYPKNIIESNQTYHYWRFRNFLISFFHASLTGFGYFVYDTIEMLRYVEKKGTFELVLHHFMVWKTKDVMGCFSNTIFYNRFIGLNMIALLIELSNIFLHFRQFSFHYHQRPLHVLDMVYVALQSRTTSIDYEDDRLDLDDWNLHFGQLSKPNSIDHKFSKAIASSDDDFTQ